VDGLFDPGIVWEARRDDDQAGSLFVSSGNAPAIMVKSRTACKMGMFVCEGIEDFAVPIRYWMWVLSC
jgi:hypothetical protein